MQGSDTRTLYTCFLHLLYFLLPQLDVHFVGYGFLSCAKLVTIYLKKHIKIY